MISRVKRINPIEKIVFDTDIDLRPRKKQPIRKHIDLEKLFKKKVIYEYQLSAGEILRKNYESSFHYNSSTNLLSVEEVKSRSKSRKTIDKSIIQNIHSYDRYHRALMSISNPITRDISIKFCIDNISLTKLDKQLGNKHFVAEIRLWYGLSEIVKFYRREKE